MMLQIMFTESLTHGDEAQREIKKLMDFFEREHELGVIPLDLEQKVIRKCIFHNSDNFSLTEILNFQMFYCKPCRIP